MKLKIEIALGKNSFRIVEQDESLRGETDFTASNGIRIFSGYGPEWVGNALYIRGSNRGRDDVSKPIPPKDISLLVVAVNEFNGCEGGVVVEFNGCEGGVVVEGGDGGGLKRGMMPFHESYALMAKEASKKSERFEDAYLTAKQEVSLLKREFEEFEEFENPPKKPRHRESAFFHGGKVRFVEIDRREIEKEAVD
ncbi:MAG: hypothetical protein Q8O94_03100 [bacterium]|nr:hypothetical protein [bacterium]